VGAALAAIILVGAAVAFLTLRVQAPPHTVLVVEGTPPRTLHPGESALLAPGGQRRAYPVGVLRFTFDSDAEPEYRVFDRDGNEVTAVVPFERDFPADYRFAALFTRNPARTLQGAFTDSLRTAVRDYAAERGLADLLAGEHRIPLAGAGLIRFTLAPGAAERRARATARALDRRVLLVGVDGADWRILRPLLDEGRLPHLARLIAEGASGPLQSITPLLSPLIWTTAATGVSPERHGILDFVTRTDDGRLLPVGSGDRRVPALWNLVEPYAKTVAVVGWLATYPAEAIPGSMITDRFGFLPFAEAVSGGSDDPALVWPPERLDDAVARRVSPAEIDPTFALRFVDVPAETLANSLEDGFRQGRLVNNLLHTLAAAETSRRLSRWLLEEESPHLALFYFEMIDAMGHLFMPYAPPRLPWIEAADVDAFGEAVDAAYRYQDEILGDLLAAAGDSTLVVVMSDHGFKSGEARLREASGIGNRAAARWHLKDGILVLAGPGVRRGAAIEDARVHDIAPTLLAWLGIPPPGWMEGRVLSDLFTLELPEPLETTDLPAMDMPAAKADTTATALNNLGLRYLQGDRPEEAVRAFERALELEPALMTARNNLANALMRVGRHEEAHAELERIVGRDPDYAVGWMNLGLCRLRLDDPAGAIAALERAAELEPRDPRVLRNLGFAQLEATAFQDAGETFTRSLELDETAAARFGLGVARGRLGDFPGARRELERALELQPDHAAARRALDSLPAD
jgi:Flp pilus assembly protein TadD